MLLFLEAVFKIVLITVASQFSLKIIQGSCYCMRNFSSNNQCAVMEELACFQYSLNYKNSNYRENKA